MTLRVLYILSKKIGHSLQTTFQILMQLGNVGKCVLRFAVRSSQCVSDRCDNTVFCCSGTKLI